MHILVLPLLVRLTIGSIAGTKRPVTPSEIPSGIYRSAGQCLYGNYGNLTMEVTSLGSGQAARLSRSDDFERDGMGLAIPLVWKLTPNPGSKFAGMEVVKCSKFFDDGTGNFPVLSLLVSSALGYSLDHFFFCIADTGEVLAMMAKTVQYMEVVESVCLMVMDGAKPSSVVASSLPKVHKSTAGPSKEPAGYPQALPQAESSYVNAPPPKVVNKAAPLPPVRPLNAPKEHADKASALKRPSTASAPELGEPSKKVAAVRQAESSAQTKGGLPPSIIREGLYSCDPFGRVKECTVFVGQRGGSMQCSMTMKLTSGKQLDFPVMELVPSESVRGCLHLSLPSDDSIRMKLKSDLEILRDDVKVKGTISEASFHICNKKQLVLVFAYRGGEPSNEKPTWVGIKLRDF